MITFHPFRPRFREHFAPHILSLPVAELGYGPGKNQVFRSRKTEYGGANWVPII
jgi:hypothetical protein